MKRYPLLVLFLSLLTGAVNTYAQQRNNLVIANDHLILLLDMRSSKAEIDSILKKAGLKNANSEKILKGDLSALKNDGWNIGARVNNVVQLDKSLTDLNENPQNHPYQLTTKLEKFDGEPGYPEHVAFGINKYAKLTVTDLPSGFTRFTLPGYLTAKRVLLSGNFNNWSTLKGLMTKTATGWVIDLHLAPGAYEYKYIVNGRWMTDPNNLQQVNDGAGIYNSIYFKYNYTFKLTSYSMAHRVTLAGSFNKWNPNEIILNKTINGWEQQLYLGDGMHTYRFLVDGKWITDPANTEKVKDDAGNINSVLNMGETVAFKLNGHTDAKKVFVAGNFNKWKPDEIALKKNATGWQLPMVLGAGNYSYKFIVDGNWITDPANPHSTIEDGETNSFIAVKPNHTFSLKGYANAKKVTFNTDINNWEPNGYTMVRSGDGWAISLYLKPGKYRYKFRVDGNWILDPGNKLWEQNEFNTGNSVLWVE